MTTIAEELTAKALSDAVTARIHAADRETIDGWLERAVTADTAESVVEG